MYIPFEQFVWSSCCSFYPRVKISTCINVQTNGTRVNIRVFICLSVGIIPLHYTLRAHWTRPYCYRGVPESTIHSRLLVRGTSDETSSSLAGVGVRARATRNLLSHLHTPSNNAYAEHHTRTQCSRTNPRREPVGGNVICFADLIDTRTADRE